MKSFVACGHDGEMHVASLQPFWQVCAAVRDEVNLNPGVAFSMTRDAAREKAFDHLRGSTHAKQPCLSAI